MASKVKPIKPGDVEKLRAVSIPDVVLEVFNAMIAKKWNGSYAVVKQDDVMAVLEEKGLARKEVYENHWLDVEDSYRMSGWKVFYDKPAYCESYDAYFKFSK